MACRFLDFGKGQRAKGRVRGRLSAWSRLPGAAASGIASSLSQLLNATLVLREGMWARCFAIIIFMLQL